MSKRDITANSSKSMPVKFTFDPARYHAISIGINSYQDEAIKNLRTAQGDAEYLAKILIKECGFLEANVRMLVGPEETCWNGINSELRCYINQLNDDDALLIYFAGHGKADTQTEMGYWIPADGKLDQINTWFNHNDLQSIVKAIRARHVAVISDSCFAGRLLRLVDDNIVAAVTDEPTWYHNAWNHRSRTVLTSGDDHPVSDEGSAGHSIFNLRLTDYLRAGPKTVFTLSDIYTSIRDRIQGQRVCYGPMHDEAHDNGEFVLCRVTAQKSEQSVPPPTDEIDPADIEVTNYQVEPIVIEVEVVNISEPTSLPADLPPVPKEYYELQAKITGIERTIARLKDNSDPSLKSAKQAVQDAKSQNTRLRAEYKKVAEQHTGFSEISKELVVALRERPETTASGLLHLKPESISRTDFTHCVVWVRKVLEAKQVHQRVRQELEDKRNFEIGELGTIQHRLDYERQALHSDFIEGVILDFLEQHGLLEKEGPFPEEQLLNLIPRMTTYPFNDSEDTLWLRAEIAIEYYWKKERERLSDDDWLYIQYNRVVGLNGRQVGPMKLEELQEELNSGALPHDIYVWSPSLKSEEWVPANSVMVLTDEYHLESDDDTDVDDNMDYWEQNNKYGPDILMTDQVNIIDKSHSKTANIIPDELDNNLKKVHSTRRRVLDYLRKRWVGDPVDPAFASESLNRLGMNSVDFVEILFTHATERKLSQDDVIAFLRMGDSNNEKEALLFQRLTLLSKEFNELDRDKLLVTGAVGDQQEIARFREEYDSVESLDKFCYSLEQWCKNKKRMHKRDSEEWVPANTDTQAVATVGNYSTRLTRETPGYFIFLLDQSFSMSESFRGSNISLSHALADMVNNWLDEMITKATEDSGAINDWFEVSVLGYRTDVVGEPVVGSAFLGNLEGRKRVLLSEIAENILETKKSTIKWFNPETGELEESEIETPVWIRPVEEYGKPMCSALHDAYYLAEEWIQEDDHEKQCFPPVVINIACGDLYALDGNPTEYADPLTSLSTEDGNVLLFNCHINPVINDTYFCPNSLEQSADDFAKIMYEMLSILPGSMIKAASEDFPELTSTSRGMVYNGDNVGMLKLINLVTLPANSAIALADEYYLERNGTSRNEKDVNTKSNSTTNKIPEVEYIRNGWPVFAITEATGNPEERRIQLQQVIDRRTGLENQVEQLTDDPYERLVLLLLCQCENVAPQKVPLNKPLPQDGQGYMYGIDVFSVRDTIYNLGLLIHTEIPNGEYGFTTLKELAQIFRTHHGLDKQKDREQTTSPQSKYNSKPSWWVVVDGHKQGPISQCELEKLIELGKVDGKSQVWKEGMTEWMVAQNMSAIIGLLTFLKAAEQGDSKSQYMLGDCYYLGEGVSEDKEKAVGWYLKAAKQGHADTQNLLGECYKKGSGLSKNYTQAAKWFLRSAKQGNIQAQYNLGFCYKNGLGVSQDKTEAVKLFRKAAKQGHTLAQIYLGDRYDRGWGVPRDTTKAMYWYHKAAVQGDAEAQNKLGNLFDHHERGSCVSEDAEKAVKWYRKAAEQGNASAQNTLGFCYQNGVKGVSIDMAKALYWYHKAAEQGSIQAQCDVGFLYQYGEGISKDVTKAVKWYRKAAEEDNRFALYYLGLCSQNGKGVSKDMTMAVKLYRRAAELGFNLPTEALELLED